VVEATIYRHRFTTDAGCGRDGTVRGTWKIPGPATCNPSALGSWWFNATDPDDDYPHAMPAPPKYTGHLPGAILSASFLE
jgi:hypothetical protein